MSASARLPARAWILVPVAALAFLLWVDRARIQRVAYVSNLPGRAAPAGTADAASPTGYPDGQRELIVPERNAASFAWITETQQMFARRQWRVRHVDYENAPSGHFVSTPSPYRWWLGLVAWGDHAITGRPMGQAVEHAALLADPVLHGLLLVGGTALVAWVFGAGAAALFAAMAAAMFPFAAGFLPGVPEDRGLAAGCALGSVLALLAGLRARGRGGPESRWFAAAGIVGGFGLWVSVPLQGPVLAGLALGGFGAAWSGRGRAPAVAQSDDAGAAWRVWSCSGAATVLVAYLLEFFPAHLGMWRLGVVHPLYGLAWIGAGEWLAQTTAWLDGRPRRSRPARRFLAVLLAAAAVAAVPAAMKLTGDRGLLAVDESSFRLSNQPMGVVATSLWAWIGGHGFDATVTATLLPLLFAVPAGILWLRRSTDPATRAGLALAFGPVAVALAFSCWQLAWWRQLDAALLALAVAAIAAEPAILARGGRWLWSALAALVLVPGLIQLRPHRLTSPHDKLTPAEAQELIERQLAHWLTQHAGAPGAVVFAPPLETTTLDFYGELRGLGTFDADNSAGFRATITLASVTSLPEAQLQVQARGLRYLVFPSWDSFFDDYARLFLVKAQAARKSVFIPALQRLDLPPWLRPCPFELLAIGGYEGQSVLVLEVVDEQRPPVALGRLAEYFVETGELDRAAAAAQELRRFPGDVGALTAQAQVAAARGDDAGAAQLVEQLQARLAAGGDRYLPWDRRVSLAIVLARGKQFDAARAELRRCLQELDDAKARFLSTGLLYNMLVLSRAFDEPITDPKLQALTLDLLPPDLSAKLKAIGQPQG